MMYSGCNVPPSLDYKREGKGAERASHFDEDGVLSDWEPSFLLFCHCFLQALEGRLYFVESSSASGRGSIARCVYVCVGVSAWSLTGLPVVISNGVVLVLLS